MTVGQRISSRRIELGLSVDEVAKRLNKNRATVYRYESDYIENLPIGVLEPLAQILHTTPAYLMGWQDSTDISNLPNNSLSEKFASEYPDLLKDNNFMDVAKLFNAISTEYRALCLGLLIGVLQKRGIDTQSILGY